VPGSPQPNSTDRSHPRPRALHPGALLLAALLAGIGIAFGGSPLDLAICAAITAAMSLRTEARSPRDEIPLWGLAAVAFLAHALFPGQPPRIRIENAATIALRFLTLLYLLRWAARAWLGRAARWLLSLRIPTGIRPLLLALESARHAVALTPLAIREAGEQHQALRARGLKPGPGASGRARYLAAWLLPFLGTMLRLSESYGDTLMARGYRLGARRGAATVEVWGWPETGLLAGGTLCAAWLLRGF
jgi:energy-coupling factor transporter transmembrane protein EcfT